MHRWLNPYLAFVVGSLLVLSSSAGAAAESRLNLLVISDSFEQFKAGQFDKLDTTIGTWTPTAGLAIVDDKHAKTGKNCLQLTGGKQTSVTLNLAEAADTTGDLTFWAERWTNQKPVEGRQTAMSVLPSPV